MKANKFRTNFTAASAFLALFTFGPLSSSARAGYRQLGVVYMAVGEGADGTGKTPAGKCLRTLKSELTKDPELAHHSLPETVYRSRVSDEDRQRWWESTAATQGRLLEWEPARWFVGPKGDRATDASGIDMVVLVACQPEARLLRVVAHHREGATWRSEIRNTSIGAPIHRFVGAQLRAFGWAHFVP